MHNVLAGVDQVFPKPLVTFMMLALLLTGQAQAANLDNNPEFAQAASSHAGNDVVKGAATQPSWREIDRLQMEAVLEQLRGNFAAAEASQARLLEEVPEPVGHVLAFNTLIGHLTWNNSQEDMVKALAYHAGETKAWCKAEIKANPNSVLGHYYCGQASFAMALYNAIKRKYLAAGRQGSLCIKHLEKTLQLDPGMVDAKLYLGLAYFAADNLPPFIRFFSRVLWFVPTGNSEKSLPYLRDVMEDGYLYPDIARYIYSSLLLREDDDVENEDEDDDEIEDELMLESLEHLEDLVHSYPANPRFQIRMIGTLLAMEEFQQTIDASEAFLSQSADKLTDLDLAISQVLMVRAWLGLDQLQEAEQLFEETKPLAERLMDDLPDWTIPWYLLTQAQLDDLAGRRDEALATYKEILGLGKSDYVSDEVKEAAQVGLDKPWSPEAMSDK